MWVCWNSVTLLWWQATFILNSKCTQGHRAWIMLSQDLMALSFSAELPTSMICKQFHHVKLAIIYWIYNSNPFPEAQTNKIILEKTFALCPELKDKPLEIVKYNVGLRPSRIGGVRIENETISKWYMVHIILSDGLTLLWFTASRNKKQRVQVTHAYGHGGFGVQSSWGSAEHIIETMEKGFSTLTSARL